MYLIRESLHLKLSGVDLKDDSDLKPIAVAPTLNATRE
jgi:hypothetical protein